MIARPFALAVLLAAFLITGTGPKYVVAQTPLVIPLLGHFWPTKVLAVAIESPANEEQKAKVADSLRVWTLSQTWFWQTYSISDTEPYFLGLVDSNSFHHITISFLDKSDIGGSLASSETQPSQGAADHAQIKIDRGLQGHLLTLAIMHELGHALGLGHITKPLNDVMAEGSIQVLPSTLDLYGIYKVAKADVAGDAVLPADVPFRHVPQEAIPEFEGLLLVGALGLCIALLAVRRFRPRLVD